MQGLAWYEQQRMDYGEISFKQHMIMNKFVTRNAGNVTFSELHAGVILADIDGNVDVITSGSRGTFIHWNIKP